jgi:hypothetical protein
MHQLGTTALALVLFLSADMALPQSGQAAGPSRPARETSLLAQALAGPMKDVEEIVFADKLDPDYRQMLGDIRATKAALHDSKRFSMPGFRPGPHYVREMKRYGILPPNFDSATDPINPYDVDEQYWRSFWSRQL